MFECGGGKEVQGVIKHHNSVSLPRVKETEREEGEWVGGMKGSPTSMSGREEGGRWEEKRSTKLPFCLFLSSVLQCMYFLCAINRLCFVRGAVDIT